MLTTHLKFWLAALGAIADGRRNATLSYTVFGFTSCVSTERLAALTGDEQ